MKPIKLTQELIQQMTAEFMEALSKIKLSDGKVSYQKSFEYKSGEGDGVKILFEPAAYAKMLVLLHSFSDEVAWYGIVDRQDNTTFVIKDILVYPQIVTGVTVDTDQEEYQKWLMKLDDETFNHLRMQGHSHVNMATSPSKTDTDFYTSILSQVPDDDYYIFMIFNKRLEHTVKVYDLKNNILYEDKDIEIGIHSEEGDLETFLTEAKELVARQATTTSLASVKSGKKSEKKKAKDPDYTKPYPGLYTGYEPGEDDDDEGVPAYSYGYGYGYNSGYGGYGGKAIDYDEEIFGRGKGNSYRRTAW